MSLTLQIAIGVGIIAVVYLFHVAKGSTPAEAASKALHPSALTTLQAAPQKSVAQMLREDADAAAYRILVDRLGSAGADRHGSDVTPAAGASAPKQ